MPRDPRPNRRRGARDEFPRSVVEVLAKHAGQRCSICKRGTVGRSYESTLSVAQIGVAAHITAAAAGGPRYDPSLSPDERSSIANAIWLCAAHARLIDVDVMRYTADLLRQIKSTHESAIARALGGTEEGAVDLIPARVSSALLNWEQTVGREGTWLDREELRTALRVVSSEKSSVQLLLGVPGSGKSALLAKLGTTLQADGKQVVALRVDQLPKSVVDQPTLAKWAEAGTSLMATLAHMAASKPTVLLVDQLDSLADLVDLQSERLNVVLELLDAVHGVENLHVIASCRTFEFKHDARFRRLAASPIELALPSWHSVAETLRRHGIEPGGFPEPLQEILRTPQHLKIFLQLVRDHPADYTSYHGMLEALWSDRVLGDAPRVQLVDRIAKHMSEEEVLVAPSVLADGSRDALKQLLASGILRQTGAGIAFAHQTLFEFARARAFAAGGIALDAYVLQHQDGLFVRPVLWSALTYVRTARPGEYARVFKSLWSSPSLRLHVRVLLSEFTGQVSDPTPDEVSWFGSILESVAPRRAAVAAMAGNQGWFDALRPTLPALMRADNGDELFGLLSEAARFAGAEVVALLEGCWDTKPERSGAALHVLRSLPDWDARAIALVERIFRAGHVERWAMDATIAAIAEATSALAPRAISAALETGIAKAKREVVNFTGYGFERTNRVEECLSCGHELIELGELASAEPASFVSAILPPFAEATRLISDAENTGPRRYPRDYGTEFGDGRLVLLAEALAKATARVAAADPDAFTMIVRRWAPVETAAIQRVLASGLSALPSATRVRQTCDYLLADPRRMALPAYGEEEAATVELLRSLGDSLTLEDERLLETAIFQSELYLVPEESSAEARAWRQRAERRHRARLLAVLPVDKLSAEASNLIDSEPEVVQEHRAPQRPRHDFDFIEVGSPMKAEDMLRASDDEIVGLFEELPDSTGWSHPNRSLGGGSIQASREFASFAKLAPDRAVNIVRRLAPGEQEFPVCHALSALGEAGWAPTAWEELVLACDGRGFGKEEFRWHVAHALAKHAAEHRGLSDQLAAMLERWLTEPPTARDDQDGDDKASSRARAEQARKQSPPRSILFGPYGFEVLPRGNYPVMRALFAGLMLRNPPAIDRWLSVLEGESSRDASEKLWAPLAYELRYLEQASDRPRAASFLRSLFARCPKLLAHHAGVILVAHLLRWMHEDFGSSVLHDLRGQSDAFALQAAGELAVVWAWVVPSRQAPFERLDPTRTTSHERVGIALAAARLWSEPRFCRVATDLLATAFRDPDPVVRLGALDVFRIGDDFAWTAEARQLLDIVTNDPSLMAGIHELICSKMKSLLPLDPSAVVRFAKAFLDAAALRGEGWWAASAGPELAALAVTLQRLSAYRDAGMDLFERLLSMGVYGIDQTLFDLDARPRRLVLRQAARSPRFGRRARA